MLSAVYFILILFFWEVFGLCVTRILFPREGWPYQFLLAPWFGFCHLNFLTWVGFKLGLPGTESYANYFLLSPLVISAAYYLFGPKSGSHSLKNTHCIDGREVALVGVMTLIFMIAACYPLGSCIQQWTDQLCNG